MSLICWLNGTFWFSVGVNIIMHLLVHCILESAGGALPSSKARGYAEHGDSCAPSQ